MLNVYVELKEEKIMINTGLNMKITLFMYSFREIVN